MVHKAFYRLVLALTLDQEEAGGGRKKDGLTGLRGHHSILAQDRQCLAPGTPWGVPHLGAAVFLDAAGMRLIGDPNCLRGGGQGEVKWAGGRPGCEKPRKHT